MLYCSFYLTINAAFYGYIIGIFCDCNIFYCATNNKGGGAFIHASPVHIQYKKINCNLIWNLDLLVRETLQSFGK